MVIILSDEENGEATFQALSPYIANLMIPLATLNLPIYILMIEDFRKSFWALIRCVPASRIEDNTSANVQTFNNKP